VSKVPIEANGQFQLFPRCTETLLIIDLRSPSLEQLKFKVISYWLISDVPINQWMSGSHDESWVWKEIFSCPSEWRLTKKWESLVKFPPFSSLSPGRTLLGELTLESMLEQF
jgi:hypothetical protein